MAGLMDVWDGVAHQSQSSWAVDAVFAQIQTPLCRVAAYERG